MSSDPKARSATRQEFREAWPVLVSALVGAGLGAQGLMMYSLPSMAPALEREFGWTRMDISAAPMVLMATAFLVTPLAGALCDRFGVRKVVLPSIVLTSLAFLYFTTLNSSILSFYGGMVLLAVCGAATNPVSYGRAVATWFDAGRGFALGLMMLGNGIAHVFVAPLTTAIVEEWGWHWGFATVSALAIIAFPVSFLLLRERPRVMASLKAADDGMTLPQAAQTRQFWALCVGILILAGSVSGLGFHIRFMLTDEGMAPLAAASVAGLLGVGTIIGRFCTGFLIDRFWGPYIAAGVFGIAGLGMLILIFGGIEFATAAAMLVGIAIGAEAELVGFFVSRYFGLKAYSTIFGVCFSGLFLGTGLSPLLYGTVHKATGTYELALSSAAVGAFVAAALFGTLGRYRYAVKGH